MNSNGDEIGDGDEIGGSDEVGSGEVSSTLN